MALIDVVCEQGHVSEVVRMAADWPTTPPCPTCQAPTEQTMLPRATQWTVEPVIVYKAPDGYRFPGDANGRVAKDYEKMGYERVELRGSQEVRRFEKHMNQREFSKAMRKAENEQRARETRESANRSELRHQMKHFSEAGKDLARAAMANNDRRPREYAKSAEFHSDIYSFDRSNREESRDAQGRRRRD